MPVSIRHYWYGLRGRVVLNYNWDVINHDSVVLISASEAKWDRNSREPWKAPRFVGHATITVSNIAPHGPPFDPNHGVTFVVNVDFPTPLYVATDIVVLDPPGHVDYQEEPGYPRVSPASVIR
jgi:hypothetical protein